MDVVEYEGDVGERPLLVHLFEVAKHTFVEFSGTDDEESVVGEMFDYLNINDKACGSCVEDDVFVLCFQLCNEFVEFAVAKQFGWVRRDGARKDAVDTCVDETRFDERLPVVGFSGEIVCEAGMFARVEGTGEGAFAQVEIEDDDFFARDAEAGGDVG